MSAGDKKHIVKYFQMAFVLFFLIWYFMHPDYYVDENGKSLLTNGRTYFMILAGIILLALILVPYRISDRLNRILGWCWFTLTPFAVYFSLLHMNAEKFKIDFWALNPIAVCFTFLFLFLVLTILVLVTGSIRASSTILAVAVAVLGIVNWYVISFRGMALSAADLFSINAAVTVASGYTYEIVWPVFSEIFCTFIICIVSWRIRRFRVMSTVPRLAVLCVWLVCAGSFYHVCCRTTFLEDHDIRSEGFTHQLRYKKYDMLFTTLCTCFYLAAEKPEGYSIDKVHEIGEKYVQQESGNEGTADSKPDTLIVIMNESFADYTDIGNGLALSEDCMPFIHSLTENTVRGYAYASIFGGNTPNSEYEFLTGNTMGFLPQSSVGFNLFVRGEMPSVASELKTAGYETMAIHPYRGTNYRRNIVYPQIGFDTYYTRDDFTRPHLVRKFISDDELSDRIIQEYQTAAKGDTPLFCYNVTIQNHGDYLTSNSVGVPDEIQVLDNDVDKKRTTMYVNLIKLSDEMFEKLVDYFSGEEERVAILMFGDHQANLGDNTYLHLLGKEEEELTAEERMEKYKIPFVLWTNYDMEEEVIEKTSLNYLYSIMADRLKLPMTGYQQYLLDLSEEIPVLAAGGYWTSDGDFYELSDEESPYYERINEYNILEYNYIFGKNDRYLELFELQEQD